MRKRKASYFCLLVLLAISSCSAATINFSSLTQAGTGFNSVGASYSQDGFTFSSTSGGFGANLGAWQSSSTNHPSGGAAATSLVPFFGLMNVTIAPTSGTFDLTSIDIAEYGAGQGGGTGSFTQSFTGTLFGGGTVSQTFTINRTPTPTLSTYNFSGFNNLTKVTFVQGIFSQGAAIQINNIVTGGTAVPEPAPMLLAGAALAALGLVRRFRLS